MRSHGNYSTYCRGCRCHDCAEACRTYRRDARKRGVTEKRGTITKPCTKCGTDFTTRRQANSAKQCQDCRYPNRRRQQAEAKLARHAAGIPGHSRPFVCGACPTCGKQQVRYATSSTGRAHCVCCSPECHTQHRSKAEWEQKNANKAIRRKAFVAPVDRLAVFINDGWKCHLCGKAVNQAAKVPHPLAPTLDHLIPIALGGTHEPINCRTAHFKCNSIKGHRLAGDQLILFG